MNDLISVIVPAYNSEKTIERCLRSLKNQTYRNIEVIVIDDGSKDNTGCLCDCFSQQDSRIQAYHIENGGVSHARNYGFKHSNGRYILCVDSDDYVDKGYVQSFIDILQQYPGYGHYWCGLATVDENLKTNHVYIADENKECSEFDKKQIMTLNAVLLGLGPVCKLYDREFLLKKHIFMDEKLSLGEDALFNFEYLDQYPNSSVLVLNKPLYKYVRSDDGSLDTKYRSNLYEHYCSYFRRVAAYLKRWEIDDCEWEKFHNSRYYSIERALRNNMRKESNQGILKRIQNNSTIMSSVEYREAWKQFTGDMHPLYRKAYSSKHYSEVLLVDLLVKAKTYFPIKK